MQSHMRHREESKAERQKGEGRLPGAGGSGEKECLMCTVSVWNEEKVLQVRGGDNCTTVCTYLMP